MSRLTAACEVVVWKQAAVVNVTVTDFDSKHQLATYGALWHALTVLLTVINSWTEVNCQLAWVPLKCFRYHQCPKVSRHTVKHRADLKRIAKRSQVSLLLLQALYNIGEAKCDLFKTHGGCFWGRGWFGPENILGNVVHTLIHYNINTVRCYEGNWSSPTPLWQYTYCVCVISPTESWYFVE